MNNKTTSTLTNGVYQTTQSSQLFPTPRTTSTNNPRHHQRCTRSPQSPLSNQPHASPSPSKQPQTQPKQWSQTAQSHTPSAAAVSAPTSTQPTIPKTNITRPVSHGKTSSLLPPNPAIVLLASSRLHMVCSRKSNFQSPLTRRRCCRMLGSLSMMRDILSDRWWDRSMLAG